MKNKDKVIKYMEEESNFNGSFSEIEHRINVQNIVIKENLKKGGVGFGRLKTAFLCLTCSVLCFVGGYSLNELFNKRFTTINQTIEYSTYEEMENAYYEYQELYPEEEITFFDIDILSDCKYFINGDVKYYEENMIDIENKEIIISNSHKGNSYYDITFMNKISHDYRWYHITISGYVHYQIIDSNNEELLKICSYNNDYIKDKFLIEYIDFQIRQL